MGNKSNALFHRPYPHFSSGLDNLSPGLSQQTPTRCPSPGLHPPLLTVPGSFLKHKCGCITSLLKKKNEKPLRASHRLWGCNLGCGGPPYPPGPYFFRASQADCLTAFSSHWDLLSPNLAGRNCWELTPGMQPGGSWCTEPPDLPALGRDDGGTVYKGYQALEQD